MDKQAEKSYCALVVQVPPAMKGAIREIASKQERSMTQVVREALERYMDQNPASLGESGAREFYP